MRLHKKDNVSHSLVFLRLSKRSGRFTSRMWKKFIYHFTIFFVFLITQDVWAESIFALVIGVNHADHENVPTLSYADDDAVLFHQLFSDVGHAEILAEIDRPTLRIHTGLSKIKPPTKRNLQLALHRIFEKIRAARQRGEKSHFYFIYSGHGDVKNNVGYLTLTNGKLTAQDLEKDILALSPAHTNHLIIDACKSYFLVHPKRAGGTRHKIEQPFFRATDFSRRYPQTGFLLSTSSAANSHEWEEFQAGIFSHEIRSGLQGAADINRDHRISYDEIYAFVQVANSQIRNERFRPQIYMQPPYGKITTAILNLSDIGGAELHIPKERSGRYFLEDAQGVRLADFHTDTLSSTVIRLPIHRTLFLQDKGRAIEYPFDTESSRRIELAALTSQPSNYKAKGAAHEAFKQIFKAPFSATTYIESLRPLSTFRQEKKDLFLQLDDGSNSKTAQKKRCSISLAYDFQSGFLKGADPLHGIRLGYLMKTGPLDLGVRFGYGFTSYTMQNLAMAFHTFSAAAVIEYRLPLGRWFELLTGLDFAFVWGVQRGQTVGSGSHLINSSPFFQYRGTLGGILKLYGPFKLSAAGHLGQAVLERVKDGTEDSSGIEGPVVAGFGSSLIIEL